MKRTDKLILLFLMLIILAFTYDKFNPNFKKYKKDKIEYFYFANKSKNKFTLTIQNNINVNDIRYDRYMKYILYTTENTVKINKSLLHNKRYKITFEDKKSIDKFRKNYIENYDKLFQKESLL